MQDYIMLVNLDEAICHALARRLRAESFYCRIAPGDVSADALLASGARGVVLAAGCTGQAADVPQMMDYLQTGLPMLCLGDSALTLCTTLGGELAPAEDSSIAFVAFDGEDSLFSGVEDGERFLPQQRAMLIAADQGDACAAAGEDVIGIRVRQRDVWGLALPL